MLLRVVRPDAAELERSRRHLWGIAYRITGSAADADEVVQETLARAVANPPSRADRSGAPIHPWLVRVAANLSRDVLRRRRRREYTGPWLPEPVPTEQLEAAHADESGPESRYGLLESATLAFLVAAEALTPAQRTVLVLRDVVDYSVRETAEALAMSEANVKTTLHRARRAMQSYEASRVRPDESTRARTAEALARFVACVEARDIDGLTRLLRDDVSATSDGGGVVPAARKVVRGPGRIAKLYIGLASLAAEDATRVSVSDANGLPALLVEHDDPHSPLGQRALITLGVDEHGRIAAIYSVAAPNKLGAI